MSSPLLGNSNGITTPHYYADFPSKTIYDNCIAVFRNIKNIKSEIERNDIHLVGLHKTLRPYLNEEDIREIFKSIDCETSNLARPFMNP